MDTCRIGVIGIGNMGSAHARSLWEGRVPGMRLTAVCDIKEPRRRWAAETLPGVKVYDDFTALLDGGEVDGVIIATPHGLHPVIACQAFARGMHVLTEKPAGVSVGQVEEMNAAARASGRVFGIMFNQRTNPLFQRARELVRGGRLGVPKRLVWIITNWYRTQAYYDSGDWRATWSGEGGGVLLNQAPHNLDIWQWIFGMPARVRAFCTTGKYHHIEVEDDATIYAEYDRGATAAFITSTGECPGTNRLEISGDRGKLLIEDGRLRFWELAEPERAFCFSSREGFVMPEAREWTMQPDAPETAHTGILRNFADAVLHGAPLLAPGEEGIHQVALTNAAYLSSWTDDWVSLPLDAAAYEKQLRARIAGTAKKASDTAGEAPSGQYNPRWNIRW